MSVSVILQIFSQSNLGVGLVGDIKPMAKPYGRARLGACSGGSNLRADITPIRGEHNLGESIRLRMGEICIGIGVMRRMVFGDFIDICTLCVGPDGNDGRAGGGTEA